MDSQLETLLENINESSELEAEAHTRTLYQTLYLNRQTKIGQIGEIKTHDDQPVVFYEDRFEHAFYKSIDKANRQFNKGEFDWLRATRIRWIAFAIQGKASGVECWLVPHHHTINRMYLLREEKYVVWLIPRKTNGWKFSTAYIAGPQDIRRYCRQGRILWTQKNIP